MDNNEQYKLKTRRVIAWLIVIPAVLTMGFIGIWGVLQGKDAYVSMAAISFGEFLAFVLGFYFGKKVSEE